MVEVGKDGEPGGQEHTIWPYSVGKRRDVLCPIFYQQNCPYVLLGGMPY